MKEIKRVPVFLKHSVDTILHCLATIPRIDFRGHPKSMISMAFESQYMRLPISD